MIAALLAAGAVQLTNSAFALSDTEATVGVAGAAGAAGAAGPPTRLVTGLLLKLAICRPSASLSGSLEGLA